MPWRFTDDVELYAEKVWDLLIRHPAENTVPLTVIERLRGGHRWSADPLLFGWYVAGRTSGAVSMTPPFELLLGCVPDDTMGELTAALQAHNVRVPGVSGDTVTVNRFVTAWTNRDSGRAATTSRQRLYALVSLRPPTPPPPGRSRPAQQAELDLAVEWLTAFQTEVDSPVTDVEVIRHDAADRVAEGLLWLHEDAAGTVVSLAGRNRSAAGVARVGPVYTPPQHRRHGYGGAVTAACTADALQRDAERVVLFTDLANPTSNAIYQRLGFEPLRDHEIVHFLD